MPAMGCHSGTIGALDSDRSRLRIVHAIRSDGFGGVERYVATVSRALADRGHLVVAIGGSPAAMKAVLDGSNVDYWPASWTHEVTGALLRTACHANVIHTHMTAAETGALVAWPVVRAPAVTTRHFAVPRGRSAVVRSASPLLRRRFAAQISVSRYVAAHVGEPTTTVLSGVPDNESVDPVNRIVLMAQRLEPEKGTIDAVRAWAKSGLALEGWRLVIAGEGSERPRLEHEVESRAIRGVEFLGQRSDVNELRSKAGIFLATAPSEAFGLSVAEAMAVGLPVVAAAGGGHIETVGASRPDLLYRHGAPAECAAVLQRLAADVELRRRAGSELRTFQQDFLSLDRHVDTLLSVYRAVSSGSTSRALLLRQAS